MLVIPSVPGSFPVWRDRAETSLGSAFLWDPNNASIALQFKETEAARAC
jgi:hypothetical protein